MPVGNFKRDILVATASVVIKTMVVEKRQFTVAMLKQLPKRDVVRDCKEGHNISVWGYVTYDISVDIFHLIYSFNGKLHRDSDFKDKYCLAAHALKSGEGLLAQNINRSDQLFIAV